MFNGYINKSVAVLFIAVCSNLAAQQKSSADQTLTFGVSRTSGTLAESLVSLPTVGAFSSPSGESALNYRLATNSSKITVSIKDLGSAVVHSGMATTMRTPERSPGIFLPSTWSENDGRSQMDMNTFLLQNQSSTFSHIPLVLTITE